MFMIILFTVKYTFSTWKHINNVCLWMKMILKVKVYTITVPATKIKKLHRLHTQLPPVLAKVFLKQQHLLDHWIHTLYRKQITVNNLATKAAVFFFAFSHLTSLLLIFNLPYLAPLQKGHLIFHPNLKVNIDII